jgi:hypothetical protein
MTARVEELPLTVSWALLSREAGEEWDDEEEDLEWEIGVIVERLSECRFRVVEPTSLSFVGPFGPRFRLGDLIEARVKDDGRYEYVCTVQRSEVWSFRYDIGPYRHPPGIASDPTLPELDAGAILGDRVVRELLNAAQTLGGGWEFCVGHLTIEFPKQAGTLAPPDDVERLVDSLGNRLKLLKPLPS